MYTKKSHIHFVGIGGIGMSGIATILKHSGYTISGCDPDTNQDTVTQLKNLGCSVYHGNNSAACDDTTIDVLVYIPMYATTIPTVTAEIARAQLRGIPTISRAHMLAELMRTKYSVAVAGSHGKTTTTSLISHILIEAQMDPTVVIGGQLKNISSNARVGNGNFLVAEADESDRSFLQLHATLAVITSIDLEHLETYTDLDDIKRSFRQFITNLPFYGKAIICIDDENIRSLLPIEHVKTISYGIEHEADFSASNITLNADHSLFTVHTKNSLTPLGNIMLPMPGQHNVYNALGAIALAREIDIDFETIAQSLASFGGIERRFSFHGTYKGADIFDDYGHHPLEIKNTLIVARKRAKNNIIVVFQPHRYTRTEKLWSDFITTFNQSRIDTLIITDIYSAGEYPIPTVTSYRFAQELEALNPPFAIHYVPFEDDFKQIKQAIAQSVAPNDLLLFLGAGRVYLIAHEIAE
ncbi:MAG TPA: UDP-N-acetylmuramate--L-alanine ligase [Candidatus Babeliales bacterium]|jgi:UDP-N-acetylmuramate--alanine ligase|nr:UDP-N-acetylmuramate--L-alanine ligase [Candidatus Babeliales bacterium]